MKTGHAVVVLLSLPAIALATPGIAHADPSAIVIAGRERVQVTVIGYPNPDHCRVDPDADRNTQSLPVTPSGRMVAHNVAPGQARVLVWCPQGGIIHQGKIEVLPGDPVRDLADRVFAAAGSSNRVSDPTLE